VLPPQLAYATIHLLEDLGAMEAEAETVQYSEKLAQEALRQTWDRDYDRMDEYWQAAKAMLPKVAAEYLDRFWLDNYPQARDRIARFFRDEFLKTPEGELWLLNPTKGRPAK
jgi:hypothetical protein